jgi:hypothetical protein
MSSPPATSNSLVSLITTPGSAETVSECEPVPLPATSEYHQLVSVPPPASPGRCQHNPQHTPSTHHATATPCHASDRVSAPLSVPPRTPRNKPTVEPYSAHPEGHRHTSSGSDAPPDRSPPELAMDTPTTRRDDQGRGCRKSGCRSCSSRSLVGALLYWSDTSPAPNPRSPPVVEHVERVATPATTSGYA